MGLELKMERNEVSFMLRKAHENPKVFVRGAKRRVKVPTMIRNLDRAVSLCQTASMIFLQKE
jgi:hypothetical protein